MYGVVVWLDPVPFVAPSVVEDVPPPGWSMHQSNTIRRFATGTGAHCAFRAVGGAVALLHDDSRGLGIAHGREMWRWFRSEGGGRRSRRGCSKRRCSYLQGEGMPVAFIRLELNQLSKWKRRN